MYLDRSLVAEKSAVTPIDICKVQSVQLLETFNPIYSRGDLRQDWQNNYFSDRNEYASVPPDRMTRGEIQAKPQGPHAITISPKSNNFQGLNAGKEHPLKEYLFASKQYPPKETIPSRNEPTRLVLKDQRFPISSLAPRTQPSVNTGQPDSSRQSKPYQDEKSVLNESSLRFSNYTRIHENSLPHQDPNRLYSRHSTERIQTFGSLPGHLPDRRMTVERLELSPTTYSTAPPEPIIIGPLATKFQNIAFNDSTRRSPEPLRPNQTYLLPTDPRSDFQQVRAQGSSNPSQSRPNLESANIQFNVSTLSRTLQQLLNSVNAQSAHNSGLFDESVNKDRGSLPPKLSQHAKSPDLTPNNKPIETRHSNNKNERNTVTSHISSLGKPGSPPTQGTNILLKREPFQYKPMLKVAQPALGITSKDQPGTKQKQRMSLESYKPTTITKRL